MIEPDGECEEQSLDQRSRCHLFGSILMNSLSTNNFKFRRDEPKQSNKLWEWTNQNMSNYLSIDKRLISKDKAVRNESRSCLMDRV